MSWQTSDSSSEIVISSRSSPAPARLRTTIKSSASSTTVGGVIQFSGFTEGPPPSAQTMKVPSALIMSRRTASGSTVVRRPV